MEESEGVKQSPLHLRAPCDTVPQTVPKSTSREGSPLLSETLESSTLGSVTSDETVKTSEFRRTLETARATAEKAAQLRQKERDVLQELSRVPLEDVLFSSDILPEKDVSSGSASSLQSDELVTVSTPSTLSLSVTLPSELSVTATMSRTTQSGSSSRDSDHGYPLTSQIQSRFSDVSDTVSVTAATSFLTKTSQNIGFSRPLSSIARQFSPLASGSEPSTHTPSALPSTVLGSGVTTEVSGINPQTLASSSGSVPSRVSQPSVFQPSIAGSSYSPGYLDYYYQKIEEERQLFEAQRNRIRSYSDLSKKTAPEGSEDQTSQVLGSMRKNVHPTGPLVRTSPYISDQYDRVPSHQYDRVPSHLERNIEDTNKENQGYIANSTGFRGQDRLQDFSRRLGTFEKTLTTGPYSRVATSSYASKPLSMSDWSHGSSTEYMSLPREAAGVRVKDTTGSTLSSLSELTEMMTRLTSTSDESDVTSLKSHDALGTAKEGVPSWGRHKHSVYAPERAADAGFGSSLKQSSLIGLEGNINTRGSSKDRLHVPSSAVSSNTKGSLHSAPTGKSNSSFGAVEPHLYAPGPRWTRGSDGKQWFVLSRSHTLSSGGGILEKDSGTPGEVGADNVFPDADENKGKSISTVDLTVLTGQDKSYYFLSN